MFQVVLLTLVLGSVWICRYVTEEMPVLLAGIIGIVCFLLSLYLAPWPVLLCIAIALLFLNQNPFSQRQGIN